MKLQLIENFGSFSVYEHLNTGKGVLRQNNYKGRKANSAVFDDVSEAMNKGLAVLWGASVDLTTYIPEPKGEEN